MTCAAPQIVMTRGPTPTALCASSSSCSSDSRGVLTRGCGGDSRADVGGGMCRGSRSGRRVGQISRVSMSVRAPAADSSASFRASFAYTGVSPRPLAKCLTLQRSPPWHALRLAAERVTGGTDDEEAEVLIELKNVKKSFGKKTVLDGASFKIRRGEAVGIIGSSGTGKSTVLRIMAGLLAPDEGEVWIRGKAREGLLSDEKDPTLKVGMVFQSAALFDSLTVGENVGFKLYEHSNLPDDVIRERIKESLSQVGLSGAEDKYPAQLSGGMKKRAALARAIIKEDHDASASSASGGEDALEEVVMYDEPTAGLDPVASTVVEDLMRNLHTGSSTARPEDKPGGVASYIVVTHQHSTIRRAVDRLIFLHAGKVVWEGTSKEFDTSDEPIVRQFAMGSLKGPIVY